MKFHKTRKPLYWVLSVTTWIAWPGLAVCAGDVASQISANETVIGMPVILTILFQNVSEHDPPSIPEADGLDIQSLGLVGQNIGFALRNGVPLASETAKYQFVITPLKEGTLTVPAVTVRYDNRRELTGGFRLKVAADFPSDLLQVEVTGKRDFVYVGQEVEVTLNIWLQAYTDARYEVTLSEAKMWSTLSRISRWGIFADVLQQQLPSVQLVFRTDGDGKRQQYYQYQLTKTLYPKRSGKIDLGEIRIVAQYPTQIGRMRTQIGRMRNPLSSLLDDDFGGGLSPFGSRLGITATRLLTARATADSIQVKPIPTEGQPAGYRGAVGVYKIATTAVPEAVKVDDPITLHIKISGEGPLDSVQAPPLDQIDLLTSHFKVTQETLAGVLTEEEKVFSTTIRPNSMEGRVIPSIPFSFFDPEKEQFVTVQSDPIAITVRPADQLSLDAVVGANSDTPNNAKGRELPSAGNTFAVSPLTKIYAIENLPVNLSGQTVQWIPKFWWLLFLPLVVLVLGFLRNRQRLVAGARRFSSADLEFRNRIDEAQDPADISAALLAFLNRKLRVKEPSLDGVVGRLRSAGLRDLAIDCERIMDQSRRSGTGGIPGDNQGRLKKLKEHSLRLADSLPANFHHTVLGRRLLGRISKVASCGLALCVGFGDLGTKAASEIPVSPQNASLTSEQIQTLLREANQLSERALLEARSKPNLSQQHAAKAAEKYRLVTDSGVFHPQLYFNMATAYWYANQKGNAIANYRRALKQEPANNHFFASLRFAETHLPSVGQENRSSSISPMGWLESVTAWITKFIAPGTIKQIAIMSWVFFWGILAIRVFFVRFPWKIGAIAALVTLAFATTIFLSHYYQVTRDGIGVITQPTVSLRSGDGETFDVIAELPNVEGHVVDILIERAGWAKISLSQQITGWIPQKSLATI